MKIMANRLDRTYLKYKDEFDDKAISVLMSGRYILGEEVSNFEKEWSTYIGTKYCVGLASGLDALWIAFRLLEIGQGDEVIVSANAYIACVMGITINGATPILVEPDEFNNIDALKIEEKITKNTKAILAVHLFGQSCDMDTIMSVAKKYNLKVVEDCAQSHGNHYRDKRVGNIGDIGCFSFYPSKGCGAFGDGGWITTNDERIYNDCKVFRNYGSEKRYYNKVVGTNSRLDELQAGLLRVKLKHLDDLNTERINISNKYTECIDNKYIVKPKVRKNADSTWHQYVVHVTHNSRNDLINYLNENEIGTIIHYPIPPHMTEAYRYLGYHKGDFPITEQYADEVLSLPMYNGMTNEEQEFVIDKINKFK